MLPYTGSLPQNLVDAAVGLLGQAWSVATAPAGALPADVLPIGKQIVTIRANDLSEAGLRVLIGEQPVKAVEDLVFDFYGSDVAHAGFDDLRRRSTQGLQPELRSCRHFCNGSGGAGDPAVPGRVCRPRNVPSGPCLGHHVRSAGPRHDHRCSEQQNRRPARDGQVQGNPVCGPAPLER